MKKREDSTAVSLHPHTSHWGPSPLCNAPGWYPVPLPCRALPEPVHSPTASRPSTLIPGAVQDPVFICCHPWVLKEVAEPGGTMSTEVFWAPSWSPPRQGCPILCLLKALSHSFITVPEPRQLSDLEPRVRLSTPVQGLLQVL